MLVTIILLSAVAFIAGVIDSIAGGGGLLIVPSLLLAGFPPHITIATNKFAATFGTGVALLNFHRGKKIVWKIVAYGIPLSLLGSFLGAKLVLVFDTEIVGKAILILLPIAMAITLIPKKDGIKEREFTAFDLYGKIPVIALLIGIYDGFFGPATGSLLILAFYGLLNMNLVHASGTAKVFNFASNLAGLVAFIFAGTINYAIGLPMLAASIGGNYLGSHIAIKKGAVAVKIFLVVSLVILLGSLIWQYFF